MSTPTTYDPDSGQFLRTFNIRYVMDGLVYELPIKAACWHDAEKRLRSIESNGEIHSELIEVIE